MADAEHGAEEGAKVMGEANALTPAGGAKGAEPGGKEAEPAAPAEGEPFMLDNQRTEKGGQAG